MRHTATCLLLAWSTTGCATSISSAPAPAPVTTVGVVAPTVASSGPPLSEPGAIDRTERPSPTLASSARKAKDGPPSGAARNASPAPLPKGTVVLHVGDSMADALGKDLKKELKKRGIKNVLKYQEATYIPMWAGIKMGFQQLVGYHKPDLVIITLGGNEVAMPDPTVRIPAIKRMVKKVGDRPCLWVAAPLWPGAPHSGILDVIRENCAPCIYVDTNKMIGDMDRTSDKIHPSIRERRRWARFMIKWLEHNRDPNGKRPWDFRKQLYEPKPEPKPVKK